LSKSRLESFSDAIMAIVMTVLVLALREPRVNTFDGVWLMRDKILIYVVSFVTMAIYWVNHHHLFALTRDINPRILWVNMGFMFALTFLPVATAWYGTHLSSVAPAFTYAFVIFLADIVSIWLAMEILQHHKSDQKVVHVLAHNRRFVISICVNIFALIMSFLIPSSVLVITILVSIMWVIPNPKTMRYLKRKKKD